MSTRIAWRNLGRSRNRTLIALLAICIAQTAVLAVTAMMNGRNDWTLDAATGPLLGDVQIHALGWREDQAPDLVIEGLDARLAAIRANTRVAQAYARIYAPALAAREVDGHAVVVVGVDTLVEAARGGLLDGLPTSALPHDRTALIGSALARDAGIVVGDELAVLGQRADGSLASDLYVVSGLLDTPVDLINRTGVVVALLDAQDTFGMPDMAHEITIRSAGEGDDAVSLAAIVAAMPELAALEVLPWSEIAPEIVGMLESSSAASLVVLLVVFIAAAAGVANTMLMATFERRRELGMMLSLGTTPGRLVQMILTEAVFLGLLGVIAGSVLGGLLVAWQGHTGISMMAGSEEGASVAAFGVNFSGAIFPYLRTSDYVPGFVGVTIVSIVAALSPAIFTARLEPMEAMRS